MAEKVIDVKNLCIRYIKHSRISVRSFFSNHQPVRIYEALKNVTFSVEEGDIMGVVGKNGCGKSTLLRALAGIYSPDEGTITINKDKVALLSLGTGLKKELTGRENIYLSGTLMGLNKSDVDNMLDEITEFSELGEFVDMPVSSYSSGMRSKLAFSVFFVIESDIILIDEVLSVGDTAFKKKSYNRLREIISEKGKTAVIVSHSTDTLKTICNRAIWIENKSVKMFGTAEDVIGAYESQMK